MSKFKIHFSAHWLPQNPSEPEGFEEFTTRFQRNHFRVVCTFPQFVPVFLAINAPNIQKKILHLSIEQSQRALER